MILKIIAVAVTVHFVAADTNTVSHSSPNQVLCTLGCKCPDKGQSFMFLDCSQLGISRLPSSLELDQTVSSLSFRSNHLETLNYNTFSKAEEVQELDLAVNTISKIDNYTFAPLKSLSRLSLSHNRLSELTEGMLDGLFNLRVLELGHNVIQKMSYLSFQTTTNLQELRLQFNPIFKLPENIFRYLPHLEKLDLKDTGLVLLPDNIFVPTPRLHWLSLARNAFENVPEEALCHAPHLEIVDLSENDFSILVEGAFKRLSSISVLYLNSLDRLTRIEKDALAGLTRLKSLSCSYNKNLKYIDADVFGALHSNVSKTKTPPKEQLYFRQNALKSLMSPLEPGTWSSLNFVDLGENPWRCDCNLLWMTELKTETQVNIKCDGPSKLKGRTFNTIDPSELRCEGSWALATISLIIASMIGFGVVMLAVTAVVCSRTPVGLYVRAKQQFAYEKVEPKTETVDLEWDPTADM